MLFTKNVPCHTECKEASIQNVFCLLTQRRKYTRKGERADFVLHVKKTSRNDPHLTAAFLNILDTADSWFTKTRLLARAQALRRQIAEACLSFSTFSSLYPILQPSLFAALLAVFGLEGTWKCNREAQRLGNVEGHGYSYSNNLIL